MVTSFEVIVRAGKDYYSPPDSGNSLSPADALTNPARWLAAGYGYDNSQPVPVAVPLGMELGWTTDPNLNALWGVWFNCVAGHSYTLSVKVRALKGANPWRAAVGWTASTAWVTPDNYDQVATLSWTAPETRTYLFGVETSGPNTSKYTVIDIGIWDHSDPSVTWRPVDLDRCKVALPVQIAHGRSNTDTQPDAPECTFTYLGENAPTALGDSIEVEVTGNPYGKWTGAETLWTDIDVSWLGTKGRSLRFRGFVTVVKAVERSGVVVAWEITAVGQQAKLGYIHVNLTRPAETDTARVQAIATAAGMPITVIGTATTGLAPDNIDRNALAAIHEICASTGAVLYQNKEGGLIYALPDRNDFAAVMRLTCHLIADGIDWVNGTDNVVNHVTVIWGPEGSRTQETFRDDPSIAKWGLRHRDINSMCNAREDAVKLVAVVMARRAQPKWVMPGVMALRNEATVAEWAQVANLEIGSIALVDIETVPTPTPGANTSWLVEGWVEAWESSGRKIQLALSEYRIGTPIPWSQADDNTWQHWATTSSWMKAMVTT